MPEIKNNFVQGKMNKDLDDRLLPNGQYRDALNVTVGRSDDSDVGVVQNVKGNTLAYPETLNIVATYPKAKVIGLHVDNEKERVFYFVTDRSTGVLSDTIGPPGSSGNPLAASTTFHGIYYWDQQSGFGQPKLIVKGDFLNFSKDYLITGTNIIGDLLFFTDNLNQPRKININTAIANTAYYNSEQKVSVAKYAPFYPVRLLDSSNNSTMVNDADVDSVFLRDQFVRFSYRFKYKDKEYSTMAPFTQPVFIPKTYANDSTGLSDADISKIFETGEVSSMVNNINKVVLKIQMPTTASTVLEDFDITNIQILSRVDGDLSVRVVEDIKSVDASVSSGVLNYTYKSLEPFKTIPEDQTTRVFDDIPLRARAQEVTGNRVIYGNYTNKRSLANTILDYDIDRSTKNSSTSSEDDNLYKEYKYHNLKSRRTYQVGVVLSDIFGRQSPVLLPKSSSSATSTERSTIYASARDPQTFNSSQWQDYSVSTTNTENWGDVLRISFKQPIDNAYSASNPYGWYSYRIVVKQQEQEYYNVYTYGVRRSTTNIGFISLHGDNVNKVPRDLTDVNKDTDIAGSNVRLYPKVINTNTASAGTRVNYLSSGDLFDVMEIGSVTDFGYVVTDSNQMAAFGPLFFNTYSGDPGDNTAPTAVTNSLLAKFSVSDIIQTDAGGDEIPVIYSKMGKLAVFETEPFNSKLDIFYETSTAGLVSDLNTSILTSLTGITGIQIFELLNDGGTGLTEATSIGQYVAEVKAFNDGGAQQNAVLTIQSAQSSVNGDVSDNFIIEENNGLYKIKTQNTNYFFGQNGEVIDFTINSNFANEDFTQSKILYLKNIPPSFIKPPDPTSVPFNKPLNVEILTVQAENGSALETQSGILGIEPTVPAFEIESQTESTGKYQIDPDNGKISILEYLSGNNQLLTGTDTIIVKVNDTTNSATFPSDLTAEQYQTQTPSGLTDSSVSFDSDDNAVYNTVEVIINVIGSEFKSFYASENGFSSASAAINQQTTVQLWHDGDGDLPAVGDIVYQNITLGNQIFNSSNQFYTMSLTFNGTGNQSFVSGSDGVVTEIGSL